MQEWYAGFCVEQQYLPPLVSSEVHQAALTSGSHFLSTCDAIFSVLPQYDMDIFGVLLLVWLQKDTNCRSELKPVFIYTGIHMFTSCSIVLVSYFNKGNSKLLYIMKQYNMIHWSSQQ